MATYVEIFLRPLQQRDTPSVVREISSMIGVELRSGPEIYNGEAYAGILGNEIAVEIWPDNPELEDTADMPFSRHPYMLEFRPLSVSVEEAQKVMEKVYAAIKRTGNYSMFSAFDTQYALRKDIL